MSDRAQRRYRRKMARMRRKHGALALMAPETAAGLNAKRTATSTMLDSFEDDPQYADRAPYQIGALLCWSFQEAGFSQADLVLTFGALLGELHRLHRLIRNLTGEPVPDPSPEEFRAQLDRGRAPDNNRVERQWAMAQAFSALAAMADEESDEDDS